MKVLLLVISIFIVSDNVIANEPLVPTYAFDCGDLRRNAKTIRRYARTRKGEEKDELRHSARDLKRKSRKCKRLGEKKWREKTYD